MRTPEDHFQAVTQLCADQLQQLRDSTNAQQLTIDQALGRYCARDIHAKIASPAFDNSQMDGYAVSAQTLSQLPKHLQVGPTIAAGSDPAALYRHGCGEVAAPIMTGAKIPADTAAVIPVEHGDPPSFSAAERDGVTLPKTTPGHFIRREGSDIEVGEVVVRANTRVSAIVAGVLASQEVTTLPVFRRAKVVLCSGGAEIGGAGVARIADVNGPMLRQLCACAGIEVVDHIHTNDDPHLLFEQLTKATSDRQVDAIITSGGISHGKFEVIRQVLTSTESWFGHVGQQPGGPQGLARFNSIPVICLPGNPISTLVSFRLFVEPVLGDCLHSGPTPQLHGVRAYLTAAVNGLPDQRDQFRRARHLIDTTGRIQVEVLTGESSHLLAHAVAATCLVRIPAQAQLAPGDQVVIYPLPLH